MSAQSKMVQVQWNHYIAMKGLLDNRESKNNLT